ncbi:MAG: hypothetical protein CMK74_03630 [Pseudomonadales bacterium]|nr:hypothetical protein [Pseudomonadales bacterium]|tara:strand:+ start:3023 stop:3358 length:336 start_codon:yes stop_codon:yes gene_type:complete
MTDHKALLATASAHEQELGTCLKAWACERNGGHSVLMSYWYKDKTYRAKAVLVDTDGRYEVEMIAAHLNEKLGAGEATVKGMRSGFNSYLVKAGRSLDSVLAHAQTGSEVH